MVPDENRCVPPGTLDIVIDVADQLMTEIRQFDSNFAIQFADAKWPQTIDLTMAYVLERFDKCASAFSPFAGQPRYEKDLESFKAHSLNFASKAFKHLDSKTRNELLSSLALKLTAKIVRLLPATNDIERRSFELALKEGTADAPPAGMDATTAHQQLNAVTLDDGTEAPPTPIDDKPVLAANLTGVTSPAEDKGAKRRGRLPDTVRRGAIHSALAKHGNQWRDHLVEIFAELDSNQAPLGRFETLEIDLGDAEVQRVKRWEDLELAQGQQLKQIVDVLRKYEK